MTPRDVGIAIGVRIVVVFWAIADVILDRVSRTTSEPSAFIVKISVLPPACPRTKAILEPSGDHDHMSRRGRL